MNESVLKNRLKVRMRSNSKDSLCPKLLSQSVSAVKIKQQPVSLFLKNKCSSFKKLVLVNHTNKLPPLLHARHRSLSNIRQEESYISIIKRIINGQVKDGIWYCNRRGDFYDFYLVPVKKKNASEYLCINTKGIFLLSSGKSFYFTHEGWLDEYSKFKRLKKIGFFKNFCIRKTFHLWKETRRRIMIENTRKVLTDSVFFENSYNREVVIKLRERLFFLERLKIVDFKLSKSRSMQQFIKDQERRRTILKMQLEDIEDHIKDIIIHLCKDALKQKDKGKKKSGIAEEMSYLFHLRHLHYTHQALTKAHFVRLLRFVGLCDFFLIESKVAHLLKFTQTLLNIFSGDAYKEKKKRIKLSTVQEPIFIANLDTYMKINLFPEELKKVIDDTFEKACQILLGSNMLVTSHELKIYREFAEDKAIYNFDYMDYLRNHPEVISAKESANKHIDLAFEKVENEISRLSSRLNHFIPYKFFETESLERHTISEIKRKIEIYKTEEDSVKQLPNCVDFNLLRLEIQTAKQHFLTYPQQSLRSLSEYVPKLTEELGNELLHEIRHQNALVIEQVKSVDIFIAYRKNYSEIEVILPGIQTRVDEFKGLVRLIDEHKFSRVASLVNLGRMIESQSYELEQKMHGFWEKEIIEKIRFAKEIDNTCEEITQKALEMTKIISELKLDHPTASACEITVYLDSIEGIILDLYRNSLECKTWQVQLDIPSKAFRELNELMRNFFLLKKLWSAIRDCKIGSDDWKNENLFSMDNEKFAEEVKMYYKNAISNFIRS